MTRRRPTWRWRRCCGELAPTRALGLPHTHGAFGAIDFATLHARSRRSIRTRPHGEEEGVDPHPAGTQGARANTRRARQTNSASIGSVADDYWLRVTSEGTKTLLVSRGALVVSRSTAIRLRAAGVSGISTGTFRWRAVTRVRRPTRELVSCCSSANTNRDLASQGA